MVDDPDVIDPDSPEYAGTDWEGLQRHGIELDPALVEAIRSRGRLKQITLRIGVEQIAEARRVAAESGLKYQGVLRQWLAEGASRTRIRRGQTAHGHRRSRGP